MGVVMNEEDLEPTPSVHVYVNQMLEITGKLLEDMRGSVDYHVVDDATEKLDEILIEMRHAKWEVEIG